MASKRLRILQRLTELLENVEDYNLASKVWRGRTRPGDESEFPYLIIFEQKPEGEQKADQATRKMPWVIGVQGYAEASFPHTTDNAHLLMAAVKRKLGEIVDDGGQFSPGANYMMNGLVDDMDVDGGMAFSPDETTNGCYFGLMLTFTITETLGDPDE